MVEVLIVSLYFLLNPCVTVMCVWVSSGGYRRDHTALSSTGSSPPIVLQHNLYYPDVSFMFTRFFRSCFVLFLLVFRLQGIFIGIDCPLVFVWEFLLNTICGLRVRG